MPDFDLDTAISADLDGDLDAYAADVGEDPAALRAALDRPAARARADELRAARDALATPPALDDLTARRLVGAALAAPDDHVPSRPARRAGRPPGRLLAAAAAALVVVVGGAVLLATRDDGGDAATRASGGAASSADGPAAGNLGDLGTIDRAVVDGLLGSGDVAPSAKAPKRDAGEDTSSQNLEADGAVPLPADGVTDEQIAACARVYGARTPARFTGSGTYQGRPAVVVGVPTADRLIVFVVAAENCSDILYSASR